jgi:hypothetical protein
LETVISRGAGEENIEQVVSALMSTHPSNNVQQTGADLLHELETQRKTREEAFETKANAVLSEVPAALTKAEKPADLDGILKDLQSLNNPQAGLYGSLSTQALTAKITATFQFVTQWQDYLSARSTRSPSAPTSAPWESPMIISL